MRQKEIIEQFYTAFQKLDVDTMLSLYHDDIEFTDPAFGTLKGNAAKNMWRMICSKAKDFSLNYNQVTETSAHWEASYIFSATGNNVLNKIDATFEFKDGKISKHTDVFNLHNWASQAMGFKGKLLGGTSFFKRKLNKQTQALLAAYTKKNL
ncbi:MAG: nuclear transport factor 2 family protein [Flavobacteriaceae bacterium]|mgnify:CR=1 FL=1